MKLASDSTTVESTANVLTGPFEVPIPQPVEFYDNTLREGNQSPGVLLTADEKVEIARALDACGIHWANVGFPVVSQEEYQTVERITRLGLERLKTAVLCRLTRQDIDVTAKLDVDLISIFLAASDTHLEYKLKLTEDQAIAKVEELVPYAKSSGKLVAFTIEDATRTPLKRVLRMFQAAEAAGADQLYIADTLGILTPVSTYMVVRTLASVLRPPLGVHFHDDLGLALANTLAALQAGARLPHVTVNGIGERAGNTCLEELAVVLKVKYGRDLGIHLHRLFDLSMLVHKATGTEPPPHKAVTGKWAFTHESGIHVAGILANPETYQPYPPSLVGRQHEIVFGKQSGRHGVAHAARLAGIELSDEGCLAVLDRIKVHGQQKSNGPIDDELVLEWIRAEAQPQR